MLWNLNSLLMIITSWSKDGCCTSRRLIQVQCRKKKGGKDGLKEKIVVLESISCLQRETLYFIGQNFAMWPPLSSKGVWEIEDSCFLAPVIDEDKGVQDWELFWRTHA